VNETLLNIKATPHNQPTATDHHSILSLLPHQHSSCQRSKNIYSLRDLHLRRFLIYSEVTLESKNHDFFFACRDGVV